MLIVMWKSFAIQYAINQTNAKTVLTSVSIPILPKTETQNHSDQPPSSPSGSKPSGCSKPGGWSGAMPSLPRVVPDSTAWPAAFMIASVLVVESGAVTAAVVSVDAAADTIWDIWDIGTCMVWPPGSWIVCVTAPGCGAAICSYKWGKYTFNPLPKHLGHTGLEIETTI